MKACIIGLGLIGGSFALALRKMGYTLCGVEKSAAHAEKALERKLVDEVKDISDALEGAQLVVIATPVDAALKMLPEVLIQLDPEQILIDLCSTKGRLCEAVANHPKRTQYVACHPMAGTEFSGPEAAIEGLFDGQFMVICEGELSSSKALQFAEVLFAKMNMRIVHYGAEAHDMHAAFVSHISHVSSFALALTVLDKEKDDKAIFQLAAGGFTSTVRLAKSAPHTWVPIFRQNRQHLLDVMDAHLDQLMAFRTALEKDNAEKLAQYMSQANEIKRIIN